MKRIILCLMASFMFPQVHSQSGFNGLDMNMGSLYRISDAKTRSISPENFTGEKGKGGMAQIEDGDKVNVANSASRARDLGQGWKVHLYAFGREKYLRLPKLKVPVPSSTSG